MRFKPCQAGDHIRAFAGECASAITVLALFSEMVLKVRGVLVSECKSLLSLKAMLDIYFMGDDAVKYVLELRAYTTVHHASFGAAYGLELMIPKVHLLYHNVDHLEESGVNLNCWAPERYHKVAIQIGRGSQGQSVKASGTCGIARRAVLNLFKHFSDPASTELVQFPTKAVSTVTDDVRWHLLPLCKDLGYEVQTANKMTCQLGEVPREALVLVALKGAPPTFGNIQRYFRGSRLSNGEFVFFMEVLIHNINSDGSAVPTNRLSYFNISQAVCTLPYARMRAGCFPLVPEIYTARVVAA